MLRCMEKSGVGFGGEVLEVFQRGFAFKNSSFELLGLDGFEDFLEARAGLEAELDEVLAGDERRRDERLGGELGFLGLEEFVVVGEAVGRARNRRGGAPFPDRRSARP